LTVHGSFAAASALCRCPPAGRTSTIIKLIAFLIVINFRQKLNYYIGFQSFTQYFRYKRYLRDSIDIYSSNYQNYRLCYHRCFCSSSLYIVL